MISPLFARVGIIAAVVLAALFATGCGTQSQTVGTSTTIEGGSALSAADPLWHTVFVEPEARQAAFLAHLDGLSAPTVTYADVPVISE